MKTPEELLKSKYLLKADYPHCPWVVNTILTVEEDGELYCAKNGSVRISQPVFEKDVHKYPELFYKMAWHEGENVEDICQLFVRVTSKAFGKNYSGVYKVDKWENTGLNSPRLWFIAKNGNTATRIFINNCIPITEQEYNELHQGENPARSVATDPQ